MSARTAVVAGGGIGGLAAAIGLRRRGWEVVVLEAAPELREVGAGITLWVNALRALELLGLPDPAALGHVPEGPGGIWTAAGELLVEMAPPPGPEPMMVGVHRADLQRALLDALGREHVRTGARVARFRQDPGGVTVVTEEGDPVRGDVLVGADGLRSAVRERLHGPQPPRYAGYTAWRGVAEFPHAGLRPGESMGRGVRFGRVPLPGGRVYWYATADAPEGARSPDGEKAAVLRLARGWHDPVAALVEATPAEAVLRGDVADRPPLSRWGEGRVTLLGDAAHPMTPNLGQGACQALEDAAALVRALERVPDPAAALAAYERERRPRANGFVRRSLAVGRVGQWSGPLAVRLREGLLRRVGPRLQPRQLADLASYRP